MPGSDPYAPRDHMRLTSLNRQFIDELTELMGGAWSIHYTWKSRLQDELIHRDYLLLVANGKTRARLPLYLMESQPLLDLKNFKQRLDQIEPDELTESGKYFLADFERVMLAMELAGELT